MDAILLKEYGAATNNIAEYEGLVTGLRLAKNLGIQRLLIRGDS
jgi:ribonuclease HI